MFNPKDIDTTYPSKEQLKLEGMLIDDDGKDMSHAMYGLKHTEASKSRMMGPRARGWSRPKVECPDCGNMYASNAIWRHRQSENCPPRNIHATSKYTQNRKEKYAQLKADPKAYRAYLDAHNQRRKINNKNTNMETST